MRNTVNAVVSQPENPQDPVEEEVDKKKIFQPTRALHYIRNRTNPCKILCSFVLVVVVTLATHRSFSLYMNTLEMVNAPIFYMQRRCPEPTYPTLESTGATQKPRICLTTLTDKHSPSRFQRFFRWRNYDQVMELTWENKVNYAKKHGYKVFDGSHLIEPSRPPAWTKIRAAQRVLHEEECDWVLWLDADTVIMNSDIKLESLLPADDKHDFIVGTDDRNGGHNSGVWFFRNTTWSKQFLNDWWNMKGYVRPPGFSLSGDNNALKALLNNMPDFDDHVLVPPRCRINSFAKFFTERQLRRMSVTEQEWYMSENYYHDGDFIGHVAGYDNKAGMMKLLLQAAK